MLYVGYMFYVICGLHQLVVSHSDASVSASLGSSVTKERPFCLLKITRRASQLLEEEVELNWLRVESPENDSGLASLGSGAYFLFTRGLIMVSKLVCQDASRTG